MMLDSGACQKIMDTTDDSLAALCLNCVWETDPNYDAFPVHGADWLNVASDLARQEGVTDSNVIRAVYRRFLLMHTVFLSLPQSMAIWRDFLYQWLYHKFQQQSQRSNCDFVFYFAVQYTEPGFRNGNLARKMMSYYIDETTRQNGYFGIMV